MDHVAGVLCLLVALALFGLQIVTTPRNGVWLNLPLYVRAGLAVTGATMLYRGVNFLTLATDVMDGVRGHINAEGLIATTAFAYTMLAMLSYVLSRTYPQRIWDRMRFFESIAKCKPRGDALQAGVVAEINAEAGSTGVQADSVPPSWTPPAIVKLPH